MTWLILTALASAGPHPLRKPLLQGDTETVFHETVAIYTAAGVNMSPDLKLQLQLFTEPLSRYGNDEVVTLSELMTSAEQGPMYWQNWSDVMTQGQWPLDDVFASDKEMQRVGNFAVFGILAHELGHHVADRHGLKMSRHCSELFADRWAIAVMDAVAAEDAKLAELRDRYRAVVPGHLHDAGPADRQWPILPEDELDKACAASPLPQDTDRYVSAQIARQRALMDAEDVPLDALHARFLAPVETRWLEVETWLEKAEPLAAPPAFPDPPSLVPWRCADGAWGYASPAGEVVLDCRWTWAQPFKGEVALVGIGEAFQLIDAKGAARSATYRQFYWTAAGWLVHGAGGWGVLDLSGGPWIETTNHEVLDMSGDVALMAAQAEKGGPWRILDAAGEVVLDGLLGVESNGDGDISARTETGWGLIAADGTWRVQPTYRSALHVKGDLIRVRQGKRAGLMGWDGAWRVPPRYQRISGPRGGLVAFKEVDGGWGFLDAQTGAVRQPGEYKRLYVTDDGRAIATRDAVALLDATGDALTPPWLSKVADGADGLLLFTARTSKGSVRGLMDKDGVVRMIADPGLTKLMPPWKHGVLIGQVNKDCVVMDVTGERRATLPGYYAKGWEDGLLRGSWAGSTIRETVYADVHGRIYAEGAGDN